MASPEERSRESSLQAAGTLRSPFIDQELAAGETAREWESSASDVELESPFLDAFEQPLTSSIDREEETRDETEAVDEGLAGEDEADWPSTESEEPAGAPAAVETFAADLGKEWARRRNGSPPADKIAEWLVRDHRETLQGAARRYKTKYTDDVVTRAWMISRREQMGFQTSSSPGVKALRDFAPPSASVALVSSPLVGDSDKAPVAPIVVRFVEGLRQRYKPFTASNYRGHGAGRFHGRGYSIDLFLPGRDERGFYPPDDAVRFLRAIDGAARALNLEWRAIYNDFSVADVINREMGKRHVVFVGQVRRNANKRVTGLNWHGPQPLILHFHLDVAPRAGAPVAPAAAARTSIPRASA
jgi:hypothetical protein